MIVVDTSALLAIVLNEPGAPACREALQQAEAVCISAGTLAEALIVASRKGVADELDDLLRNVGAEVVAVTSDSARGIAGGYRYWGKGVHPAHLNFGDCFAYALAKSRGLPLLYVGEDFSRTDVLPAVGS